MYENAFLIHIVLLFQLYVFGGKNEEQELNDLKIMKLINPSERQPGKYRCLISCPFV